MNKDFTINTNRIMKTFRELVLIDSPSLAERATCDYIAEILQDLGFKIHEDSVGEKIGGNSGNLYGFLEGDESLEPLIFNAHMDTVEPSKGKKAILDENGKITSEGDTILGADDISGIVAILEALVVIKENNLPHRPIEVIFFVSEEIYCLGSKNFDYSILKSKESYTLDASGDVGKAAYKAPSLVSFEMKIIGESGHSSHISAKTSHSIAIAAEAITKTKIGRIDEESTCNIGIIEGGLGLNLIPKECIIKGEVRSLSHEKAIKIVSEIEKNFTQTANKYNGKIEIDTQVNIHSYETPINHPVVKRFKRVCEELNIPYEILPALGGSDNNNMEQNGINGLVLSSAMNNPHSLEEYTTISELEKITKIVIKLMTSEY
ncbi:peptidase T [Methanobrevibacter cuticularis]|uniref:Peptidase T n=1 Tax=Methanobrevibacter cuticularis TaxID=47311 RepID=A0A166EN45_9EURY|nr:M20/M25/M40 family metallo-hydrolase [Methanobrevibacter cuticularis]KZX16833.1 peptidase T [Methanobrevibacter cuticularis]